MTILYRKGMALLKEQGVQISPAKSWEAGAVTFFESAGNAIALDGTKIFIRKGTTFYPMRVSGYAGSTSSFCLSFEDPWDGTSGEVIKKDTQMAINHGLDNIFLEQDFDPELAEYWCDQGRVAFPENVWRLDLALRISSGISNPKYLLLLRPEFSAEKDSSTESASRVITLSIPDFEVCQDIAILNHCVARDGGTTFLTFKIAGDDSHTRVVIPSCFYPARTINVSGERAGEFAGLTRVLDDELEEIRSYLEKVQLTDTRGQTCK